MERYILYAINNKKNSGLKELLTGSTEEKILFYCFRPYPAVFRSYSHSCPKNHLWQTSGDLMMCWELNQVWLCARQVTYPCTITSPAQKVKFFPHLRTRVCVFTHICVWWSFISNQNNNQRPTHKDIFYIKLSSSLSTKLSQNCSYIFLKYNVLFCSLFLL